MMPATAEQHLSLSSSTHEYMRSETSQYVFAPFDKCSCRNLLDLQNAQFFKKHAFCFLFFRVRVWLLAHVSGFGIKLYPPKPKYILSTIHSLSYSLTHTQRARANTSRKVKKRARELVNGKVNQVNVSLNKLFTKYIHEQWYIPFCRYTNLSYRTIEARLVESFQFVMPEEANRHSYSLTFSSILRDIGSTFDSVMQQLIKKSSRTKYKGGILHHLEFLERHCPDARALNYP
jgi:hypothetical protein